jgi:hypothetical protein
MNELVTVNKKNQEVEQERHEGNPPAHLSGEKDLKTRTKYYH